MQRYTRGQPLSQLRQVKKEAEPERNINIWGWGPMKDQLITAPDKGYELVETTIDACLMSQLYDFEIVLDKEGKPRMYARSEDIEQVKKCPVMLACSLDPIPLEETVYLISPLPLPNYGNYGLVSDGDSYHPYPVDQLPDKSYQKWLKIREKIFDLARAAEPENIDYMWIGASDRHAIVADEAMFQRIQDQIVSQVLTAKDETERKRYDGELAGLLKHHNQILMVDRLLQFAEYQERFQEIAHMMQQLAEDYYASHLDQIAAQVPEKKETPPTHPGVTNGKLLVPYCFPLYVASEAIQNAASGADRWETPDKQPPFYARKSGNNTTTVEYGREAEQQIFEEKAVINLYKEVKNYKDTDVDLMLYTLSAIIKETNGEGAAWVWASKFLDDREIKPITKNTNTSLERRAGHRVERLAEIDEAIYRLSGLWINIREYIPPKRKGGKTRVFTHRGRLWAVMETWAQNTLGENGEPNERVPVAWRIKAGDWLMEYLGPARRYVGYLCDQALKYDPYHQQDEKRLAYYFLFFLRFNAKNNDSFLVREIGDLLKACTLTPDSRNPQRARNRFEKAMDQLKADGIIDDWEYVAQSQAELPSKKWLPTWLQWQVKVYVRARVAPPKQ